jgi:bifunctional non-homologous end joining protein LigD
MPRTSKNLNDRTREPLLACKDLVVIPGAIEQQIPWPLEPQIPTLVKQLPAGDWLQEVKLDGYRLLIRIRERKAETYTRGGQNWSESLRVIADSAAQLPVDEAVIDGELVGIDDQGHCSFSSLQRSIGRDPGKLYYYAFDLLQAHGVDLRKVSLRQRKVLLQQIIPANSRIRYSDHIEASGDLVLAEACRLGAEGIVAKRADAPYRSGRGRDWLKMKCVGREAFYVGGFSKSKQNPLKALLLGRWDEDQFAYVGRVGTGFNDEELRDLALRLAMLTRAKSPFDGRQPSLHPGETNHWVEPKLSVEVQFGAWTDTGQLRHASFQGISEDRPKR